MNYVGIDIHKRYSICAAQDEQGRKLGVVRIEGNLGSGFAQYLRGLGGPSTVVIEACWGWGKIHDVLEELPEVAEVVVAHALKTRLIAESQIKTDRIDGDALATLLRGHFISPVHVPPKAVRQRKDELRQRLYWARLRTRVRNRVHAVLDRQRALALPQCSDLFGAKALAAMRALALPEPDATLLHEDLALLEVLGAQIKAQEKRIATANCADPATQRLRRVPGLGVILAAVIATEIDQIGRFRDAAHLCAYAGLVPTTEAAEGNREAGGRASSHASGGKVYHGGLLWQANRWLRWAFIEGAWVAIGCSGYFGALYRRHRERGKAANTAITIVARRMCRIVFHLLKENRDYSQEPPKKLSPAAPLKT
jgi:transposase